MALVSVNNPSNNELVSATGGQVALQQVCFIQSFSLTMCISKAYTMNHDTKSPGSRMLSDNRSGFVIIKMQ